MPPHDQAQMPQQPDISRAEAKGAALPGASVRPGYVYAICILILLGVLSFVLAFSYMSASLTDPEAQAAAAAQAAAPSRAYDGLALTADAAIVIDLTTGQTLYAKNADTQLPLASLTKVATALAVSEVLDPKSTITIPYDTAPPGSYQRLGKGETWEVWKVINFTLVASSNEGAEILASAADRAIRAKYSGAPDHDATLWRMNRLASELGLTHTYFLNASGLDVSTTQSGAYGSARDVAHLLAYAASTSPEVFAGTTQGGLLLASEEGQKTSAINTNEALGAIPGLILGKTGYTDLAGGNLGIVFDVGLAHPVVAVVMSSTREGRFTDMKSLVGATRRAITGE